MRVRTFLRPLGRLTSCRRVIDSEEGGANFRRVTKYIGSRGVRLTGTLDSNFRCEIVIFSDRRGTGRTCRR